MAVQPLLRRFVAGLAAQIPPGRLRAMAAASSASGVHSDAQGACDGAGDDAGGALRLFLEKAAESLPMGSRVRTAVGEDFERALELLREEIEGRVAREVQGDGSGDGGSDGEAAPPRPQQASGDGYPIMAFSQTQHDHARAVALEDGDDKTLQLLLCAPHAAPSHFLGEAAAASDADAVLRSLRNALLSGRNGDEALDYEVVVAKFVEVLSSEEDVPSTLTSIRQLLSCLATIDAIPDEAASSIGELVGCYAQLSFEQVTVDTSPKTANSVANVVSVAHASFSDDSAEVAAHFVRGYLRGMGELADSKAISAAATALSILATALSANGTLKDCLPVMPKMKKSSSKVEKGVRAQLQIWRSWADGILGAEEEEEEVAGEKAEEAVEQEGKTDGKLPTLPEESELDESELAEGLDSVAPSVLAEEAPGRRSTRKRKQSDASDSIASAPRRSTRARGNSESESDAGGSATGAPRRSSRRKASDAN